MAEADQYPQALRRAPSLSPDCIWEPMTPGSPVPQNALLHGAQLNGENVYIGRVEDGANFYIGTAIPLKGVCIYLNKNREVKSSPKYEILTIGLGFGEPLLFINPSSGDRAMYDLFPAGLDEKDEILYVGRFRDSLQNTYYGWMLGDTKTVAIPRDSNEGSSVIDKDFEILMHTGIHMICRGCPTPLDRY